jgi:Asp-tRNA(Asn)/Glu-tRNA(Gln) amidotransferase A subunit family amidase
MIESREISPIELTEIMLDRIEALERLETLGARIIEAEMLADFAGTPTLTVPCGFSNSGLPYALQFMGRRRSEAPLCRIGHAYEGSTDWHERYPSVARTPSHRGARRLWKCSELCHFSGPLWRLPT